MKPGLKHTTIDLTDRHQKSRQAIRDGRVMLRFVGLLAAAAGVLTISFAIGSVLGLQSSKAAVERHVSVWEEEIAKNLLLKGDVTLFEKVKSQIPDVARDVSEVLTSPPQQLVGQFVGRSWRDASSTCAYLQTVPITLYGTPSGNLYVCRSYAGIVQAGLQSPVFFLLTLIGLLAVFWVDRRREMEAARLQAAKKTAEALEQLAKQVAHDIRSPVGALNVINESLIKRDDLQSIGPHLELLKNAAARITKIADDLLSNPHSSTSLSPDVVVATVKSIVREKQIQLQTQLQSQSASLPAAFVVAPSVELQISPPNAVPLKAESGSSQIDSDLGRVLSNLIQNALEAPRAEGIAQTVLVDLCLEAGDLKICIKDNGLGIDEKLSRRLGRRGLSLGKRRGNGLGVAHARDWVQARGGRLVFETTRGHGTEVKLNLPR